VSHQVLCHGRNDAILLQTMIHGVSQGVKMELARRIFDILDARPFQIMTEGFSLRKNAVEDPIRRCRPPLFLELDELYQAGFRLHESFESGVDFGVESELPDQFFSTLWRCYCHRTIDLCARSFWRIGPVTALV
jgi:hypothetical protein